MSTVATLLSMIELDAPTTLQDKQAKLIVRRVVAVSQDLLHEDIRCECGKLISISQSRCAECLEEVATLREWNEWR
jgi:hypothetical protein